MTEAHSNPDLVAFHRQSELEASQREYQELKTANPEQASSTQELVFPTEETVASERQPLHQPTAPASSPLSAIRLSVVAVILLGLLLLVLRQRRKSS